MFQFIKSSWTCSEGVQLIFRTLSQVESNTKILLLISTTLKKYIRPLSDSSQRNEGNRLLRVTLPLALWKVCPNGDGRRWTLRCMWFRPWRNTGKGNTYSSSRCRCDNTIFIVVGWRKRRLSRKVHCTRVLQFTQATADSPMPLSHLCTNKNTNYKLSYVNNTLTLNWIAA